MKMTASIFRNKKNTGRFILLIFPVIFFFEPLIGQKVLYWGTTSTQFFPWMEYAIQHILSGDFPLWNPYNGWGAPFMANYQTALFYPLNWLLIVFALIKPGAGLYFGYTVLMILHFQIGVLGFYRLLTHFRLNEPAKLLGSAAFIFSGYIAARVNFISMVWAVIWMPWIISGVVGLFSKTEKPSRWLEMGLIVPLVMQLLAGHAQTAYYTLLIAGIIFISLWIACSHKWIIFIKLIVNIMIGFGISAVQLIPTAEYLLNSQRSQEVGFTFAANFSLWPWRLLSAIFPDFWGNPLYNRFLGGGTFWEDHLYIGVFPLLFMGYGTFVVLRNKTKIDAYDLKFFRVCLAIVPVSLLFALGKNFVIYPLFYKYVPTFDMFQAPSRFIVLYTFCGAVLAAVGFDIWQKEFLSARKSGYLIFTFIAILIGVVFSQITSNVLPAPVAYAIYVGSSLAIIWGGLTILKEWLTSQGKRLLNGFVLLIVLTDLCYFSSQNSLFKAVNFYEGVHQKNLGWQSEIVFLEKKSEEFVKFNQNFRFDRFQDFQSSDSGDLLFLPNTNLFTPAYHVLNNFDPFVPGNYSTFMEAVNRFPIEKQKKFLAEFGLSRYISLGSPLERKLSITHLHPSDRVQWYDCGMLRQTDEILVDLLYNEAILNKPRCLYLTNDENISDIQQDEASQPEVKISYQIDEQRSSYEIRYTSESDGWLLVQSNFYPGWKAVLDNQELIETYEANYLFTGIPVPHGSHTIKFYYDPFSFKAGALVSIISMLIAVFLLRKTQISPRGANYARKH